MTDVTDIRARLTARLAAEDARSTAAHWTAQWAELEDELLEQRWRDDMLTAQAAGADAAEMERLTRAVAQRFSLSRRAIAQTLRGAEQARDLPTENTTDWWARRWIAMQDELGSLRPGPGCAYYTRDDDPVWRTMTLNDAMVDVGQRMGGPNCRSRADYRSTAKHAFDLLARDRTRPDAYAPPAGVALGERLLRLEGARVVVEDLREDHLCRFRIEAEPRPLAEAPLYRQFLETFAPDGDEHSAELRLAFGKAAFMVLFNLGEHLQQCVLFFGAAGSGKSTAQAILSALVPEDLRCSVPPDRWQNDYQLAHMSRAALNVVEDLQSRHLLDDGFKRFIGNQTAITAREPYGLAFDFRPHITHLFSANELPATRVHDEGFWRRWIVVPFTHKIPNATRITRLAERIIAEELGAVVQHALDASRAMFDARGQLSNDPPKFQAVIMQQWEREQNVVLQFLEDEEWIVLEAEASCGRTLLYETYREWCRANGYADMARRTYNRELNRLARGKGLELRKRHDGRIWTGVGVVNERGRTF